MFASAVYDSNARARAENRTEINLKSVLIGNGITRHSVMWSSYVDMQCSSISVAPVQNISTCVGMRLAVSVLLDAKAGAGRSQSNVSALYLVAGSM